MKKKMVFTITLTVALFVLFSVPCFSQVINGCYHNKNGKLRVVSDLSLCKKAELPITWNVTGPQGPPMLLSANDEPLGILLGMDPNVSYATVFIPSLEKITTISTENGRNQWGEGASLYFTGENCTGDPFWSTASRYQYFILSFRMSDSVFLHGIISPDAESVHVLSQHNGYPGYECVVHDAIEVARPVTKILLPFAYPVALPLKFEQSLNMGMK